MLQIQGLLTPKLSGRYESQEQRLSRLSPEQRAEALAGIDPTTLAYNWRYRGRPDQLEVTDSTEHTILFSIGRGGGKTHTGAEWIRDKIQRRPDGSNKLRFAFLSRTAADVRDVMIQGDSGVISVFPPSQRPEYISSQRVVRFHDGSEALMFSSIEPAQLRGPQFHFGWVDELAALRHIPDESGLTAWDNMQVAVRLGDSPQILATSTPKRIREIKQLYARAAAGDHVHLVTGASTYDNPYLSPIYKAVLESLYGGSRLSDQELYAKLLDDVEGALWKLVQIRNLDLALSGKLPFRVVGVDPSVAENPRDECGIVVAGATGNKDPLLRHGYVLDDRSLLGPPSEWAQAVVDAARFWDAPVVAEVNNGGALVKEVIQGIDPGITVKMVSAKQNKALRAEPVTLAYDQKRVHHIMPLPELEDQMTTWIPTKSKDSPDRIDALVYALTGLVTRKATKINPGKSQIHAPKGYLSSIDPMMASRGVHR